MMRVAIMGTRGIPARYGGFETFAEELAARMASAGHQVTVYTRAHTAVPGVTTHRGAAVRTLPSLRLKALETISHTLLSCLDASRRRFDVVLLCNAANAPLIPLLHARRLPVTLNVDGLERKRRKWGAFGRTYYRACERLSARWADELVSDARVIQLYYRRAWRRDSVMIPYGGDLPRPDGDAELARLGLIAGTYFLYVSRFELENNPDQVVAAYRGVGGDAPLVMVGGAPYSDELIRRVRRLAAADPRVKLPGAIYGEGYRQLLFNARAYIHATEVGGTHPALVEAMGAGRMVFFLDNISNREVVGDAGVAFSFGGENSLTAAINAYIHAPQLAAELGAAARTRVLDRYRWDDVAAAYERLLEGLCSASRHA
jgi:glycosyltransferase involved in cell wall biosynthesis